VRLRRSEKQARSNHGHGQGHGQDDTPNEKQSRRSNRRGATGREQSRTGSIGRGSDDEREQSSGARRPRRNESNHGQDQSRRHEGNHGQDQGRVRVEALPLRTLQLARPSSVRAGRRGTRSNHGQDQGQDQRGIHLSRLSLPEFIAHAATPEPEQSRIGSGRQLDQIDLKGTEVQRRLIGLIREAESAHSPDSVPRRLLPPVTSKPRSRCRIGLRLLGSSPVARL
jgi:hypothetical protein